MMLFFENDYSEGAHPYILRRLLETNMEKLPGYGNDRYTEAAKEKIRCAIGNMDADVFLIAGGTQTNLIVISTMLRRYEGVVSATTGHVNGHEAGAIEYTGHKVLTLLNTDGKISACQVREYVKEHYESPTAEHTVQPGMVYISFHIFCSFLRKINFYMLHFSIVFSAPYTVLCMSILDGLHRKSEDCKTQILSV